jgi:hypothetical protein
MKTKKFPRFLLVANFKMLIAAFLLPGFAVFAQEQVYDNFDGAKVLHYGERFGVLDTMASNPAPNSVNSSEKCGLYVRNGTKKFANIKMNLPKRITGVEAYATYLGNPPQLKLKVYTTAPEGTLVEVLLGAKRGNNDYPAGTHSQYQAYTTVSGAWEELKFKFSQIPQGSETAGDQIDQIVLLFNPNSSNSDTYYFDDLTGPPILNAEPEPLKAEKGKPVKKVKSRTPVNKSDGTGKKK